MIRLKTITRICACIAIIGAATIATPNIYSQPDSTGYKVLAGVNAMDYRLQKPLGNIHFTDKRFGDHLFISIEGAPTFTHRSYGQLIGTPDIGVRSGISVGDWFTPVHGMKLGVNFGGRKESGTRKHLFGGISVDYLMNLSALARGENPGRKFEFIGIAGIEYQRRVHSDIHGNAFGGHLGLQTRYNITPTTFIYLEPRISLFTDAVNTRRNWQRYDWEGAVMVGLGYRISPIAKRFYSRLSGEKLISNTFYGFSIGGNYLVNGYTPLKDHLGFNGSMYIGTWASTISGWRLMATAGAFGLKDSGRPKYSSLEANYLLNINSVLNGFNPENRFNTNLVIGPVAAMTTRGPSKIRLGAAVGLQGVIDLTGNLQLLIEPKANIFNRHFAATGRRANILGSLNIGFQYRLGKYKDKNTDYDFASPAEDFLNSNKLFMTFGAGIPSRNSSWQRNVGGMAGIGRWFSPVSAWRLTAEADYYHRRPLYGSLTLNADYMLSLTSLFCGYNPDRIFDLAAIGGIHAGGAHYSGHNHAVYGLQGAIQAKFNVSNRIDIFIEPQFKTTYAKEYAYSLDKGLRVMAGFNYKFGDGNKRYRHSDNGVSTPPGLANYIAITGGPGIFSEKAKGASLNKICGGIDIVYGRKLTNVSSVQAGLGYDFLTRPRGKSIAIGTLHADYLLNITQLADLDPDRSFHISALVGAGIGWSNYHNSSAGAAAQAGIQFKWSILQNLDLIAEPRATFWQPRVCIFPGNTSHFVGLTKFTLGAAYKF